MSWTDVLNSAEWNRAGGVFLAAYVLGCLTAGYYLVRFLADADIRELGSGSVGARNVGRVLGKTGFFLTVLCDFSKGALAVWGARHFLGEERLAAIAMAGVVVGHIWPVQLRFHGGKGMATSLGALLVLDPHLAGVFVILMLPLLVVLRRVALSAVVALGLVPLAGFFLDHSPARLLGISVAAIAVLIGHRKNVLDELIQPGASRPLEAEPDRSKL
ncbi:MAG: glycerol-3-phosphate acyltransferase [Verrucomicrobiota bacterium]